MENKTVEMVVKDLLLAVNQKKKRRRSTVTKVDFSSGCLRVSAA